MFASLSTLNLFNAPQEREKADISIPLSLHDRSFDLVLLSNWEDQIIFEHDEDVVAPPNNQTNLTTPLNKALEEGSWTQSIIWSPRAPFRDFTQLELNEEDIIQEERHPGMFLCSPLLVIRRSCVSSSGE